MILDPQFLTKTNLEEISLTKQGAFSDGGGGAKTRCTMKLSADGERLRSLPPGGGSSNPGLLATTIEMMRIFALLFSTEILKQLSDEIQGQSDESI